MEGWVTEGGLASAFEEVEAERLRKFAGLGGLLTGDPYETCSAKASVPPPHILLITSSFSFDSEIHAVTWGHRLK